MSFLKTKSPYRLICEQSATHPKYFIGSEFQHGNVNDTASVYLNTTTVANPELGGTGSIPLYERWTINDAPLTCQIHNCSGSIPCSPWERPYITNTFTASMLSGSQVTESFVSCHKTKFKSVQAKKLWQGYPPLNALEPTDAYNHVDGCGTVDVTSVSYRTYQTSSYRTKYLTIALSSDWTHTDYDHSGSNLAESVSVTQHISSGSGLLSYSGFSSTGGNLHAIGNIGIALQGFSSIVSSMCTGIAPAFPGSTRTWIGNTIDLTHDTFGYSIDKEVYDIGAGTFTRTINLRDGSGFVFPTTQESYTVTETSLTYTRTNSFYDSPATSGSSSTLAQTDVINVSATLSDAYRDTDVYGEIKDMLNEWNLADDVQYPFREDDKPQIAPLVARDEQVNNNFTTTFAVADYGNPIANQDGTTYPDLFWVGTCGLALAQDSSTGTTTVAVDFPSVSPGDLFTASVGVPFGYAYTSSAVVTYTVIGGGFPNGVTFDSSTGNYSGTATDYGHWGATIEISIGIPSRTGELIGAPLPAGYHDYFNLGFVDMKACCDIDFVGDVTFDIYQQGWGMNVSTFNSEAGTQLPLNCTNWNNFAESINKPDGAFLFYADPRQDYFPPSCISSFGTAGVFDGLYLVGCKYAVILDDWPSFDFGRPAGSDKFMLDETANKVFQLSGSCEDGITSISGSGEGSTWGLLDLIDHNTVPDGTDFSGIWGSAGVNGFYDVSYGSGVLTLATKRYDLPSDWTSASEDENFCFGKLRYPGVCSVLGRQAVTSLTDSGSGTILTWAIPQTCFGLDASTHQEKIDIYDTQMTLLTGSTVVTRVDDTQFSCSLSSSFLKDGHTYYVLVSGSAKWYMDDSTPKGDYAILEWLSDFRSQREFGRLTGSVDCDGSQITLPTTNAGGGNINNLFSFFSQSQVCLPVSPCSPKIVAISPNGEQFPNGHTYPFPTDFVMDETYGMKWWKWPQTVMTDLLWQQPHRKACIGNCAAWKNDNYGCNPDVITPCPGDDDFTGEEPLPEYFFAAPPQVEVRLTVPNNYGNGQNESAPNVPSDVQIGWLSPVIYAYGDSGSVALPPAPPGIAADSGTPNSVVLASAIHAQICGAMGGGCRFDYSTDGCGT